MLCPICKQPGGVLLFSSVAPCDACQDRKNLAEPSPDHLSTHFPDGFPFLVGRIRKFSPLYRIGPSNGSLEWEKLTGFLGWEVFSATPWYLAMSVAVFTAQQQISVPAAALSVAVIPNDRFKLSAFSSSCWLVNGAPNPAGNKISAFAKRYYW